MSRTYCPECDAAIGMDDPHEGDLLKCPECGMELEVVEVNPSFIVDFPLGDDYWDDEAWDDEAWDDEEYED